MMPVEFPSTIAPKVRANRAVFPTLFLLPLLVCSCATNRSPAPDLPPGVAMNPGAGSRDHVLLNLHLEGHGELKFVLDTGSHWTLLDESLEPQLGPRRGFTWLNYGWRPDAIGNKYAPPNLSLAGTRLKLGNSVATDALKKKFGIDGVLGMDCLRHYCLQMDFNSRQIRFLDPDAVQAADLGQSFPLSYPWGDLSTRVNLGGKDTRVYLDTGDPSDGTLKSTVLRRFLKASSPPRVTETTTERGTRTDFYFDTLTVGGNTYRGVEFHKRSGGLNANILGLRFLGRHLVTLNFPKGTMHLKQSSVGSLVDERWAPLIPVIKAWLEQDKLPGLSKNDKGTLSLYPVSNSEVIFAFRKRGELTERYYQMTVPPESDGWKLEKAWHVDQDRKVLEEYPVP